MLQADGGTRTASITGGYVALVDAVNTLVRKGVLRESPIHGQVAAVSVGIWSGMPVLDLDYAEDSDAETDMNIVMNNGGGFIEVQGTAEGHALRRHELDELLNLAANGIGQLLATAAGSAARRIAGVHMRVVLATGNAGKLQELRAMLEPLAIEVVPLSQFTRAAVAEDTG